MKLKTGILFAILSFAAGTYAEELKKMENGKFTVEFNSDNGGLKSSSSERSRKTANPFSVTAATFSN